MSFVVANVYGDHIKIPKKIMHKWKFKAIVDTDTEYVGKFCLDKRAKEGAKIRGVTFKKPLVAKDGALQHVTDEELDSEAFPYHILTLGYVTKKTFTKKPGETFTHREVLDALLELDNEDRVKSRDVEHIFFCGLTHNRDYGLYVPIWVSESLFLRASLIWEGNDLDKL